ncbi:hypothetical protein Ddye_024446 [Dipteronia dyeriana]|uniref:Transposase n=1 Tax=Dipteronia dyeriana TaxID=168575 RepID=A0AAD9TVW0_9ROSI|nr:hypothetical protein Ddye_024446 [Dipteronia dyeriana]
MDATKLVIHHGGSWVSNCYEGGMKKWVTVPRCVSYDGLVKLVEDVAKVDVVRYNLQLWSLAFTISGTARPRIENDNDVSCMMNVDKLLPEVFVSVSAKEATDCVQDDNLCKLPTSQPVYDGFLRQLAGYGSIPIVDSSVCNDETIDVEENNCQDGVGYGFGCVGGHGCAGPSGFATFSDVSFREDGLGDDVDQTSEHSFPRDWIILGAERYSFESISTKEACSDDGRLYEDRIFQCKKDLKRTLNMYALKEGFEVRIRRSSKTRYEAGYKDGECEFHLHGIKMQKEEYWVVRMFRAKDHAEASVFGPPEESFKLMLAYCHRLEEVNPGTITALKTNVVNQFEYMFIAHVASLNGFRTMIRPVIAIDGTHLKAICLDANNQVFPLAYGFGDIEDEMSWTWFLNELKNAIGSPEDCMIISDRHLSIKDYKRKDVSLLFKQVWKAYRKFEFKEAMLEMMKVNRVAFKELMNVGPERWSRAYSPIRRYRLMTSSIVELMNSCLVHAFQMPITTMIEFIRDLLQKWFYKRQTKAKKTRTQLTP